MKFSPETIWEPSIISTKWQHAKSAYKNLKLFYTPTITTLKKRSQTHSYSQ